MVIISSNFGNFLEQRLKEISVNTYKEEVSAEVSARIKVIWWKRLLHRFFFLGE